MPRDEVLQLMVLKRYFNDRLGGKGKMQASIDAAYYSFDRGVYLARVIRGWARLYEYTESLPPPRKRGKHTICTSALDDEDIREQCLSYFRSLPPNARSATKLKAYNEQVVYPEGNTKDIYHDDHNRADVVEYRKSWTPTMINYRTKMREYGGEDCSEVIMLDLQEGDKEIVLVTHDECYFNSNDDGAITWTATGEFIIKKKARSNSTANTLVRSLSLGRIVTVSGYPITWYNSLEMPRKFLFCFDQSSNNQELPPDALVVRKLTLKDKMSKETIKPGYFELKVGALFKIYPTQRHMPSMDGRKALRTILQERQLWRDDLPRLCQKKAAEINPCEPTKCCNATHILSQQQDFCSQQSRLEIAVRSRGHLSSMYPKSHCECNFIERVWGNVKGRHERSAIIHTPLLRKGFRGFCQRS
ncbi:uncharacterized protein V1513DRAFT_425036 [Lipomyces chichibuensis]|uniref:uncharacterized protein n=1 Tax=Lipomyces chichibuensis TaxID=1546026 RepID=UPI0033435FC4